MITVTHPCGHTADFDASWTGRADHFCCPTCGLAWHVETYGQTVVTESGFRFPPERRVVVEPQQELHLSRPV